MSVHFEPGDKVTYADPRDEVERSSIGTMIGHFPDADPPRSTVRWENSNMKIAPVLTHHPSAWALLDDVQTSSPANRGSVEEE